MKKAFLYWGTFFLLILLAAYGLPTKKGECIESFNKYVFSKANSQQLFENTVEPLAPWEVEASLPQYSQGGVIVSVEISRMVDDHIEVWSKTHSSVSGTYHNFQADRYKFFVYRTDTQEWKVLDARIEGTSFFVGNLFVLQDGTIYGQIFWDKKSEVTEGFLLGRYSESAQQFEIVENTQMLPTAQKERDLLHWSKVFVDSNDMIWMIANRDAIYSYDPHSGEVQEHAKLPGIYVAYAALSPDGSIYVKELSRRAELEDHGIFQYTPGAEQLKKLESPKQSWPGFGDMIVRRDGSLWMGAIGWRVPDGTWHRIHSKSPLYALKENILLRDQWFSPYVIRESSNGYIWFKKDNGMAWYDPQTEKGCWFTTEYADNIIEDQAGDLWIIVNNELYKHPSFH